MTLRDTDYAALAQDSYKDPILNKKVPINGVEYRAIAHADDAFSGFQATAYEHINPNGTHEVIIAYRGTEFDREPVQDGVVDAAMVTSAINGQAFESELFTKKVMDQAKGDAYKNHYSVDFSVTGHSLGGTLAEINAYKYGLHGETYNSYGSAGLMLGIPAGGNQIIDNVRATDVVSAASPHFGEVRTYATQQDIEHLSQAGYRNDGGLLSARNLLGEVKKDGGGAHAIANFAPDKNGNTIMTSGNQALAHDNERMVSRYRNDIRDARVGLGLYTGAEEGVLAVNGAIAVGHGISRGAVATGHVAAQAFDATRDKVVHTAHALEQGAVSVVHDANKASEELRTRTVQEMKEAERAIHDKAVQGLHATERAAEYVGHETVKGYDAAISGIHAAEHAGHQAYGAAVHATSRSMDAGLKLGSDLTHQAGNAYELMKSALPAVPTHLDNPAHPDHVLFRQAQGAVHRLDAEHGRTPNQHSDNFAASVVVAARASGLSRVDHVVLSDDATRAFAVQGELRSFTKQIADPVEVTQALNTPIAHSSAAWEQAMQHRQQAQTQVQTQQQAQQQQSNPILQR